MENLGPIIEQLEGVHLSKYWPTDEVELRRIELQYLTDKMWMPLEGFY